MEVLDALCNFPSACNHVLHTLVSDSDKLSPLGWLPKNSLEGLGHLSSYLNLGGNASTTRKRCIGLR